MIKSKEQSSVLVNQHKRVDITDQQTNLSELLMMIDGIDSGAAVAVNNQIVTKDDWAAYILNNDDKISIFGAIAGG